MTGIDLKPLSVSVPSHIKVCTGDILDLSVKYSREKISTDYNGFRGSPLQLALALKLALKLAVALALKPDLAPALRLRSGYEYPGVSAGAGTSAGAGVSASSKCRADFRPPLKAL